MRCDIDILVAGGGPAGLAAAAEAASRGASVLVVEREQEIGRPVHTSGGMAVKIMRDYDVPADLYHVIRKLRIIGPTEATSLEVPDNVGCVIDVTGVYQYLAARAQAAGAEIRTGVRAEVLKNEAGIVGARLHGADGVIEQPARMLMDATGYRAALSKAVGLHPGFQRFGVGAEYELLAPNYDQDEMIIIVGSRFAPKGYAWAFPWGDNRVRVGVGLLHSDTRANPSDYLELLLREAGDVGIDLSGSEVVEEHRGLIPSEELPATFVGDRILAVGDAAAQPTLVAGEGIRLSLLAGTEAGRAAVDALKAGEPTRDALLPYEQWFRKHYGFSLKLSYYANRRMASWDDPMWDERVRFCRKISGNDMVELLQSNFDTWAGMRWLARHPKFWGPAAKYSLRTASNIFTRRAS